MRDGVRGWRKGSREGEEGGPFEGGEREREDRKKRWNRKGRRKMKEEITIRIRRVI